MIAPAATTHSTQALRPRRSGDVVVSRFAFDCVNIMAQYYFNKAEKKNKILNCWRWLRVVPLIHTGAAKCEQRDFARW
jgi:hypothetical protein